MAPQFTIVTPCYRGSKYLNRLYNSLLKQSRVCDSFEWIIVDDFSNDDETKYCIQNLMETALIDVKCIYLEQNFYASKSVYSASLIAQGDYLIILDQDDMLSDDALSIFSAAIENNKWRSDFAGVCGRCLNSQGYPIGGTFPKNGIYANELWIRHVKKHRGELFQCTKTSIIRNFFDGMLPGYTNGWAWSRIAHEYSYFYVNDIVRLYDTDNVSSVSNMGEIRWVGNLYKQTFEYIDANLRYLIRDPILMLRFGIHCVRFEIHAIRFGMTPLTTQKWMMRWLIYFVMPISFLLALRDRKVNRVFFK